ncbi:MAG TPA: hypothetical protein EYP10_02845 [Armatimonadetes bacterium]|nr:hypothetical protein [Armatimonadota bacterium]
MGDKFIELCRRMRVGGMELYAPFNKTGDFYPDAEPAYRRGNFTLSRAQMRNIYEIANIASCNLSYVIPTKCERQMATTTYTDSVVRLTDGSFFLRDHWCVISPRGREKLAAMFAWGNSFGENLRRELRQIVSNYQPDGFYLDNGAFVWCDYGRMTQWMAFDDDGRIYTNAGIAYAMLLDELRTFAPSVHRNPGEFIQYFSGFRAQSHLTNSVDTQPFYVRTHRLIMGYKPIFVDHPDRITKERLFDALELGGLPWLANFKRDREALVREWAPAAIALARAGWQPITNAVIDNPSVRIERFGSGSNALFTVRNLADEPTTVTVRIRGRFPKLSDFHGRVQLNTRVDDEANVTIASFVIPADELVVLRAMPSKREVRRWRKLKFLMDAEPTSIVIVASAKPAMRHIARCIKGFVELQAELLSKDAHVEIVHSASRARFANRVIIFEAQVASISIPNPRTLMVGVADEWSTRELLCEYLDSVEMPLSNAPPEWRLAVPMPVE